LTWSRPHADASAVSTVSESPRRWVVVAWACACLVSAALFLAPESSARAAPSLAAVPGPADVTADVRLRDQVVFSIHVPRAGTSAQDRARAASAALTSAVDDPQAPGTQVDEQGGEAVVFAGKTPVISLTDDDAAAAGTEATLHVYAADVAAKIDRALRAERRRSAIAENVFSFSLLVFSGVVAFVIFRRVSDLARTARLWVRSNPYSVPALKLGRIEVARPEAVRSAAAIGLAVAHRAAEFAIVYFWLIFALSRFEATRAYTDRLAGFVLVPLSALIGRLGAALPLVVVAGLAAVAVGIAVRFADLFFAGVGRGETHVAWLPMDLARPTSLLVRAGIVLCSIVLAAPLITGSDDGALSRAGVVALVALGLACTPLLACAAAGIPVVFGRRIVPGSFVQVGGSTGLVKEVTLLELVLEDPLGCQVRVPQLLGLWHVTRILGVGPSDAFDLATDPRESPAKVAHALLQAASGVCQRPKVEMVSIDIDGARWRVSGIPKDAAKTAALAESTLRAIQSAGIALGRSKEPASK